MPVRAQATAAELRSATEAMCAVQSGHLAGSGSQPGVFVVGLMFVHVQRAMPWHSAAPTVFGAVDSAGVPLLLARRPRVFTPACCLGVGASLTLYVLVCFLFS